MKPSYKTGEFLISIIFMVLGFLSLFYGIHKSADLVGIAAVLGAISGPVITQVFGRNRVKEKHGETPT